MDPSLDPKRVAGALRFLAELAAAAEECVAAGVARDELTVRRDRARAPRTAQRVPAKRAAKAL